MKKTSRLCAGVPPISRPKFSPMGWTVPNFQPKNSKSRWPQWWTRKVWNGVVNSQLLHTLHSIRAVTDVATVVLTNRFKLFLNNNHDETCSNYSAKKLKLRWVLQTLWRVLTMFTRSAISPPEVNGFGWNLGNFWTRSAQKRQREGELNFCFFLSIK